MTVKRKLMRGAAMLAAARFSYVLCSFARNIILARILLREDFGIGATFSMTIAFLEMMSNLGQKNQIIQNKKGDSEAWQEMSHAFMVIRGLITGAIIFALAPVVTAIFEEPDATWAFRVLAVVAVIRGFQHMDYIRQQRELSYKAEVLVQAIPAIFTTAIAYPAALYFRDYVTLLFLAICHELVAMMVSHLLRERKYKISWQRKYVGEFLSFGWPLAVNGMLMFGIMHGERFIVGYGYDMTLLGIYSIAFILAMTPTTSLAKLHGQLILPILSGLQEKREEFTKNYRYSVILLSMLAGAMCIMFIGSGGWLLTTLYGQDYAPGIYVVMWLGAMQAIRLMRASQAMATIALGDTRNQMYCNIVRSGALVAGLVIVYMQGPFSWIAAAGFFGEFAAYLTALWRMRKQHQLPARIVFRPLLATIASAGVGLAIYFLGPRDSVYSLILAIIATGLMVALQFVLRPDFRNFIRTSVRKKRSSHASDDAIPAPAADQQR